MPAIESRGIRSEEPFHTVHQVCLRCFCNQMEMIWEKTIGVDLPARFLASVAQSFKKGLAVVVIPKYLFATIAAASEEINRSRELDS